jgi:hypothetical protein
MQAAAIDRVMRTYGMIVNLTADEERAAREKVTSHLAEKPDADENSLAIEGLRYLRSVREIAIKGIAIKDRDARIEMQGLR